MPASTSQGADETSRIIRFLDTEAHDISEIPEMCRSFLNRLDFLFNSGACLQYGYTAYCVNLMKTARGIIIKGKSKTLGGPGKLSDDAVKRALQRMQCWVWSFVD